jgi:hypothetical protein
MKSLTSALLLFLIAFTACNKEDKGEKMPPATKSGRHVLAFRLNGSVHIYRGKHGFYGDYQASYAMTKQRDSTLDLTILASDGSKYNDAMNFDLRADSFRLNTRYAISANPQVGISSYRSKIPSSSGEYVADSTRSYIIFTRADKVVVAGTFEFYGINKNGEQVHLAEGQFDLTQD